ncbi:ATP-binding cassette domain-containing protein [Carboxylicivirga sediminis]|uniref:ATP-binding cassette domain-containing protein n=1 Tax=Carboxylicivirga sediminis TaxID=2006564 RepID=A0A941F632_9BACT|nr:ATP-binding cassette domain-containing protein [Carboxylicivirga sediminis]MBR8536603.1 ATP-binding cassette domain-containing protein [Carboxylicivirga sediminis]
MMFLEAKRVVKKYANHLALNEVDLQVPANSIYGLLGPNGAGKTTLIRIINQITGPDSGEIIFNGRTLQSNDVQRIGYLPEERGLYKKMKVGEQAIYLARMKGLSRQDAIKKLKYWFEKFEIQPWWDKKVEELSKGMQQKIQFVVTVLHEPELLIFDEPFSGFDPINANLLKQEILQLKENGATILFSTHNMGSVEELCDHITLINQSKTILNGQIDQIRQSYKDNLIKLDFLGDANAISAKLQGNFAIENLEKVNGHQTAYVKMLNNSTINSLINQVINDIEIVGLQEVLPTMNDIFIKVVEQSNLSKTQK